MHTYINDEEKIGKLCTIYQIHPLQNLLTYGSYMKLCTLLQNSKVLTFMMCTHITYRIHALFGSDFNLANFCQCAFK